MPDLVLNTRPSGSTRLTVASLYSLPLIVLKSSARAIDAKHTIKITKVGVLISATLGFSSEGQARANRKRLNQGRMRRTGSVLTFDARRQRFRQTSQSSFPLKRQ